MYFLNPRCFCHHHYQFYRTHAGLCGLIALLIILSLNRPIYAQSLDFLIRQALQNSPRLKAQNYQTKRSQELYAKESIFIQNPEFSYSYQNIPRSSLSSPSSALGEYPMSGLALGVSQKLALPWESKARKNMLWKKYLSSKEKEKDLQRLLVREISLLYHRMRFQDRKRGIIQSSKASLKSILKLLRTLVGLGKMSASGLLKVEADFSILANQLLEIETEIKKLQFQLESICGSKIKWKDRRAGSWLAKSGQIKIPLRWNEKGHPALKALRLTFEAAQKRHSHEKAKLFPDFSLSGFYIQREPIPERDNGEDFITLKISIPIPLYYPLKERHSIAAAKYESEALRAELEALRLALGALWKGEKQRADQLLELYRNYEEEVLPKYLAAYKIQLTSLVSARVSLLDVLDAYRQYLNVSVKQAELYLNLRESILSLKYMSGNHPSLAFYK